MNSTERVRNTILGKETDRQPIYGWVKENLSEEISRDFGSVEAFEDHYEFDMAHIFGGPKPIAKDRIRVLQAENEELTPDILLEEPFVSPDDPALYGKIAASLTHHKARDRFCYVQSPGFFEYYNDAFGIENHLMYLLMYQDELAELYRRQADWLIGYADRCIDLGVDMIHISDDWGSQRSLMFNPKLWWELIYPNLKKVADHVHARGAFVGLHSDGCIASVADGIAQIGIDVVHPWQESAGMSYDTYLEKYADRFAILGGVCVQTLLGIEPKEKLESEIRRVFAKLRSKRWICCTTHFVQNHCTMEDLTFAYDLIYRLARGECL